MNSKIIIVPVTSESVFNSCVCPSSSPWGPIQHRKEMAPGIWQVSTAGHGGFYLSKQRLAAMPSGLRDINPWLGAGSWYEEDCDWAIVCAAFPLAFNSWKGAEMAAMDTLKGYERATAGLAVFLETDLGRAFKHAADTFRAATLDLWFGGSMGSGRNKGWFASATNGRGTVRAVWEQDDYPAYASPFDIQDVIAKGIKVNFQDIPSAVESAVQS